MVEYNVKQYQIEVVPLVNNAFVYTPPTSLEPPVGIWLTSK
jgi:hypothetical protein